MFVIFIRNDTVLFVGEATIPTVKNLITKIILKNFLFYGANWDTIILIVEINRAITKEIELKQYFNYNIVFRTSEFLMFEEENECINYEKETRNCEENNMFICN